MLSRGFPEASIEDIAMLRTLDKARERSCQRLVEIADGNMPIPGLIEDTVRV